MNHTHLTASLSTPQLVTVYNHLNKKKVKRFSNRAAAVSRTIKTLKEHKATEKDLPKEIIQIVGSKIKVKIAPKKKIVAKKQVKKVAAKIVKDGKDKGKFPGPISKFANKKMYKVGKLNPRKPDSHGHKSYELIRNGMTYDQYRLAGGRPVDLRWDIRHGNVEMK
jgi:glycerophosphoryl diester phosphodiesterase